MTRKEFIAGSLLAALPLFSEEQLVTLRGKLTPEGLRTNDGKLVKLEGDSATGGVIHDERLHGMELEITGQMTPSGSLRILPIHKKGMFVLKNGEKLFITYWCDICSIRTYTPGKCLCCQEETQLDLRDKLDN